MDHISDVVEGRFVSLYAPDATRPPRRFVYVPSSQIGNNRRFRNEFRPGQMSLDEAIESALIWAPPGSQVTSLLDEAGGPHIRADY